MDLEKKWEKALSSTNIKRQRLQSLNTFKSTDIHYLLLAKSDVNVGDSVVRKGKISIDRPLIVLPKSYPQFEGFDFKKDFEVDNDAMRSFLLMRGVRFPSLKYNNELYSLDVIEESLEEVIKNNLQLLERKEDVKTGLVVGPNDCWQLSLLIYVATLVDKSADSDIRNIIDRLKDEN